MEAALDSIARASASEEIKALVSHRPEVFSLVSAILSEREEGGELSRGELNLLSEAIELVGQAELQIAREKYEAERAAKLQTQMEESAGVDLLAEAEAILTGVAPSEETDEVAGVEEGGDVEVEAVAAEIEPETKMETEAPVPAAEVEEAVESVALEEPEVLADEIVEESEISEVPVEDLIPVVSEEDDFIPSILESIVEKPVGAPTKPSKKKIKLVVAPEDEIEEVDVTSKKKGKSKSRTLEFDEDLGEVVVKRHRKKSRKRDDWEEYLD